MQHIPTPEEWRPVVGYEGKYEVSDHGRVRSVARVVHRPHTGPYKVEARVLSPRIAHYGHHYVTLFGQTKKDRKHFAVHRLVLSAFVGPAPAGLFGCHYDGIPSNNHVSNLRWDTPAGNMQDKFRHGNDFHKNKTHCPRGIRTPSRTRTRRRPGPMSGCAASAERTLTSGGKPDCAQRASGSRVGVHRHVTCPPHILSVT